MTQPQGSSPDRNVGGPTEAAAGFGANHGAPRGLNKRARSTRMTSLETHCQGKQLPAVQAAK
jgi:hypothetical protein